MKCLSCLIFIVSFSVYGAQFQRKEQLIFVENFETTGSDRWYEASSPKKSVKKLLKLLAKSKTGQSLIYKAHQKARENNQTLLDVILPGEGSLTDTTLVRRFTTGNPEHITYTAKSKVYINVNLSLKNALLDLAHELTHYNERKPFNPYLGTFNVEKFILSTVEGKGGEVEAFLVECQVLKELKPSTWRDHSNCEYVMAQNGQFSKEKGVTHFYQVGPFIQEFQKSLSKHDLGSQNFRHLSEETPIFISSAYGIPYPVAAIREYQHIMSKVCRNDKKRLEIMRSNRLPASEESRNQFNFHARKFNERCFSYQEVDTIP